MWELMQLEHAFRLNCPDENIFFHFISFLLWNYLKWSVVVYHVCICVSILYFFFYENVLLLRQFILDNWCDKLVLGFFF